MTDALLPSAMKKFVPICEDADSPSPTSDEARDEQALRRARLLSLAARYSEAYDCLEPLRLRCKSRSRREIVDSAITILSKLGRSDEVHLWLSMSSCTSDSGPSENKSRPTPVFTDVVQKSMAVGDEGAKDVVGELVAEIVAKPRCLYKWRALSHRLRVRGASRHPLPANQQPNRNGEICVCVADYIDHAVVRCLQLRDRPSCSSQHLFRVFCAELNAVPAIPFSQSDVQSTFREEFGIAELVGEGDTLLASLCLLLFRPVVEVFGGRGVSHLLQNAETPQASSDAGPATAIT